MCPSVVRAERSLRTMAWKTRSYARTNGQRARCFTSGSPFKYYIIIDWRDDPPPIRLFVVAALPSGGINLFLVIGAVASPSVAAHAHASITLSCSFRNVDDGCCGGGSIKAPCAFRSASARRTFRNSGAPNRLPPSPEKKSPRKTRPKFTPSTPTVFISRTFRARRF